MRIEQLEAFVEVASSKSISIAAENLYITQPSLSRSMKLLEDELGLTLFIRSSDGVRLTDSGKSLLPAVQNILSQLDSLKQQALALTEVQKHPIQSQLKIYTLHSVADSILVYAFEEMRQAFPTTEITIKIPDSSDPYQLPDLSDYDLYIGLNIGHTFDHALQNSDLQMESVFMDSFSAVVNRLHPLANRKIVSVEDILDYKLILHNYDFTIEEFYKQIITVPEKKLDVTLRSNNSRVITQLLLSSNNILITNNIMASVDYAPNTDLMVIPLRNFKYHCFCLYHQDTAQLPLIQGIIKILQDTRLKLSLNSPNAI